jgi:hypothetical protein
MELTKISIENIPNDASILIAHDNGDNGEISKERIITNGKVSVAFHHWVNPTEPVIIRVRHPMWKPVEIRSHFNNCKEKHLIIPMEIDVYMG